jgi:predicted Zn-ribbon and HTH transcriptional regulator
MMTDKEALDQLVGDFGFRTEEEMGFQALSDGVCPGICKECGYSTDVEPDNAQGWCEECQAQTVVSGMVLMGIM